MTKLNKAIATADDAAIAYVAALASGDKDLIERTAEARRAAVAAAVAVVDNQENLAKGAARIVVLLLVVLVILVFITGLDQ